MESIALLLFLAAAVADNNSRSVRHLRHKWSLFLTLSLSLSLSLCVDPFPSSASCACSRRSRSSLRPSVLRCMAPIKLARPTQQTRTRERAAGGLPSDILLVGAGGGGGFLQA